MLPLYNNFREFCIYFFLLHILCYLIWTRSKDHIRKATQVPILEHWLLLEEFCWRSYSPMLEVWIHILGYKYSWERHTASVRKSLSIHSFCWRYYNRKPDVHFLQLWQIDAQYFAGGSWPSIIYCLATWSQCLSLHTTKFIYALVWLLCQRSPLLHYDMRDLQLLAHYCQTYCTDIKPQEVRGVTTMQRRGWSRRGCGAKGSWRGSMRMRNTCVGWTLASLADISVCDEKGFRGKIPTRRGNLYFSARTQRLETEMKTRGSYQEGVCTTAYLHCIVMRYAMN